MSFLQLFSSEQSIKQSDLSQSTGSLQVPPISQEKNLEGEQQLSKSFDQIRSHLLERFENFSTAPSLRSSLERMIVKNIKVQSPKGEGVEEKKDEKEEGNAFFDCIEKIIEIVVFIFAVIFDYSKWMGIEEKVKNLEEENRSLREGRSQELPIDSLRGESQRFNSLSSSMASFKSGSGAIGFLSDEDAKIQKLRKDILLLEAENSRLEEAFRSFEFQNEMLLLEKGTFEDHLSKAEEEILSLKKQIEDLNETWLKRLEQLEGNKDFTIEQLKQEVLNVRGDLETLKQKGSSSSDRIKELEFLLEEETDKLSKMQEGVIRRDQEIQELKADLFHKEDALDTLMYRKKGTSMQKKELLTGNKTLQEQLDQNFMAAQELRDVLKEKEQYIYNLFTLMAIISQKSLVKQRIVHLYQKELKSLEQENASMPSFMKELSEERERERVLGLQEEYLFSENSNFSQWFHEFVKS